jgi:hypothetical protein
MVSGAVEGAKSPMKPCGAAPSHGVAGSFQHLHAADVPFQSDLRAVRVHAAKAHVRQRAKRLRTRVAPLRCILWRRHSGRGADRRKSRRLGIGEDDIAERGRVFAARHQVHRRREFSTGPRACDPAQVQVIAQSRFTALSELDRQAFQRRGFRGFVRIAADADRAKEPWARRFSRRRGVFELRRGGKRTGEGEETDGQDALLHGRPASYAGERVFLPLLCPKTNLCGERARHADVSRSFPDLFFRPPVFRCIPRSFSGISLRRKIGSPLAARLPTFGAVFP